MPPANRLPGVAEPVGTPLTSAVPITIEGSEGLLIAFAVATMIFVASLFLLGVWFFLNRLRREQAVTAHAEGREATAGTGWNPDTPRAGRDFTPQAEIYEDK